MENYDRAYEIVEDYQRELKKWKRQTGETKADLKKREETQRKSVREKLRKSVQLVREGDKEKKIVKKKDRGAR